MNSSCFYVIKVVTKFTDQKKIFRLGVKPASAEYPSGLVGYFMTKLSDKGLCYNGRGSFKSNNTRNSSEMFEAIIITILFSDSRLIFLRISRKT